MDAPAGSTELLEQYSAQLAADLDRNVQEQNEVSAEIAALQARLLTLQHDHAMLTTMQHALTSGVEPAQTELRPTAAAPAGTRQPRSREEPTLVSLVRGYLAEQTAPRAAAEVSAALLEAHPGRVIKTTVVRTTLEGLVAKGLAKRIKDGHAVSYAKAD